MLREGVWRKNLSELCGGFWCLRGLEPGVESEPLAIGLGCMGNPPPVTCALKEPLELGRGWGKGVLLDTVNLISLLKKKKGIEKSNMCQRRQLWSLTILKKERSGGQMGS